jgi:hypothetical protein
LPVLAPRRWPGGWVEGTHAARRGRHGRCRSTEACARTEPPSPVAGSPPEPPGGVAFAGAARTSQRRDRQRRAGDRKRRQKRARGGRTAGPTDPPDS